MNLTEHYNNLYKDSLQKITSDNYQIDKFIDSSSDNRFGITLLIRPDNQIKNNIAKFLDELKAIEPDQYYYPHTDIHITVMSLISCYNLFHLNSISIPDYIDLIEKSITKEKDLEIRFSGITASPSCIMVQGFPNDDALNDIRNNLRINFKQSELQQTIDARYPIQTAHSTVVRFRNKFSNKQKFIEAIEKYRNHNFGSFKVDALELVYNDWYQRKKMIKELYTVKI